MPDRDDDGSIDEDLRGMEPGEQAALLREWFRSRYAPPGSHATLADYGDYLDDDHQPDEFATADRGPLEALDVLAERFGSLVDEEVLQLAAERLDEDSAEWIRIPEAERRSNEALFRGDPDDREDGLGVVEARRELDAGMPADASPAERAQIERMIRDFVEQARENDPAVALAIKNAGAAAALVLERIQAVRRLHEPRPTSGYSQDAGLPGRKHNNPPPDDDEILDAVQREIWEMGLERELNLLEAELQSHPLDGEVVRQASRSILAATASTALSLLRGGGNQALGAALGVVAAEVYRPQILAAWQALLVAVNVLRTHCGFGA